MLISCELKLLLLHFSKGAAGVPPRKPPYGLPGPALPAVNEYETEGKCLRGRERDLPDLGQRVEGERGHPWAEPGRRSREETADGDEPWGGPGGWTSLSPLPSQCQGLREGGGITPIWCVCVCVCGGCPLCISDKQLIALIYDYFVHL